MTESDDVPATPPPESPAATPLPAPRLGRFAEAEDRARLREAIQAQKFGRFHNDGCDDPLPHIWWRLLDDLDAADARGDALYDALLTIAHARDGIGRHMHENLASEQEQQVLRALHDHRREP